MSRAQTAPAHEQREKANTQSLLHWILRNTSGKAKDLVSKRGERKHWERVNTFFINAIRKINGGPQAVCRGSLISLTSVRFVGTAEEHTPSFVLESFGEWLIFAWLLVNIHFLVNYITLIEDFERLKILLLPLKRPCTKLAQCFNYLILHTILTLPGFPSRAHQNSKNTKADLFASYAIIPDILLCLLGES